MKYLLILLGLSLIHISEPTILASPIQKPPARTAEYVSHSKLENVV